jgi:pyruvate/2-oxoglutarate dehydrogenase complex dihydrolipoamide acyltransferase (E2) component
MATSAATLNMIINELITAKPTSFEAAIKLLVDKEIKLPKALLEVKPVKAPSIFASKAAQDFAEANDVEIPEGFRGSTDKGKITVGDLKKLKDPPVEKKNISPSAEKFVRDNNLDITDFVGSGTDGKILLKDVKALKDTKVKEPDSPKSSKKEPDSPKAPGAPKKQKTTERKISAAAAKAMKKYDMDAADIADVTGTGKNGEVTLSDIKDLIEIFEAETESDVSDED